MSILNVGSINLDYVYRVPALTKPGETVQCYSLETYFGGKGLNQSVALARAGCEVYHAGCIGPDGREIEDFLSDEGIDVTHIHELQDGVRTGHAMIQVGDDGENSIVIYGGANRLLSEVELRQTMDAYLKTRKPSIVVLQNETNLTSSILDEAKQRNLTTIWNPAPCPRDPADLELLKMVDYLILNESEGRQLTGQSDPLAIISALVDASRPTTSVILTRGARGLMATTTTGTAGLRRVIYEVMSVPVKNIVDTTAAGDTFVGYFVAALSKGNHFTQCLQMGTAAAALCIQRTGASTSIPRIQELGDVDNIVVRETS